MIVARTFTGLALFLTLAACRNDMYNQPKKKALAESDFFQDGASARNLPAHAIAQEDSPNDLALTVGLTNGIYVTRPPMKISLEQLQRGRERFDIYCAVCHGAAGDGTGMVAQRGFPAPPSFHSDRLRNAPIGHFVDVAANGYGAMYPYAARVSPEDRWAIAAYIRALQLSRNARAGDLTPADRKALGLAP
jgi:mono/diheme cytochrome c family protein